MTASRTTTARPEPNNTLPSVRADELMTLQELTRRLRWRQAGEGSHE